MDPVCGSPNYFSSHGGYSMSPSMRSASFEDFDKLRWHDSRRELRAVIAVIRHGDRTPKQKMKIRITQKPLLDLMRRYGGGYCNGKLKQAKLKKPHELQDLLDVIRRLLDE